MADAKTRRMLNPLDRERKAGTRNIHGPEDCPAARINGCEPCAMAQFGIVCEAAMRKKEE